MSVILIAIGVALSSPKEPAILAHKAYTSETLCQAHAQNLMKDAPQGIKVSVFCIEGTELTNLDSDSDK